MPRKIQVLPQSVSQVIAAGEVIERPGSVVKELMENAVDAGSSEIVVELKSGGLQMIRVTDSGEGIDREDVPLAFQRYATSKIEKAEDLYAIRTLGFRGEALPSICQVSKMTLRTKTPHSISGTKVVCEGGEITNVLEIGCPIGTEVEVKQLFYNIPVKRKFLKSIRSELRSALNHFLRLSLSHPEISFRLVHEGRTLHQYPKTESPKDRIEAILGRESYAHLLPVRFEHEGIGISGFVSLPSLARTSGESIFLYLNQRFIKDRVIYKAVMDAYRRVLPINRFPVVVLFISLPPSAVDVNVHPTKAEVKFRDPDKVYQAVFASLRRVLEEGPSRFEETVSETKGSGQVLQGSDLPFIVGQEALKASSFLMSEKEDQVPVVREGGELPWKTTEKWPYTVLGQIRGTYILCEDGGNLVFIDQHAAHERLLFEKFKREYENGSVIAEKLLLPILLELSAEESCILESFGEVLAKIGFEIEPMGEKLFGIRSVPSFIDQKDPREFVREILDELSLLEKGARGEEAIHRLLATLACHSAIRANFLLKKEEMDRLVGNLLPFHPSTTCPHGRPVFFILPLDELGKKFKRR